MLKEVPRTGAHSEDFVLSSESPRRWPERLRIGYFAACAAWAVAWALGVAESMELLGALLIAAFVFHLGAHLVSMVWLGPVTSWSVDTGAQRVRWTCTRRLGWVERRELFVATPEEVEVRWAPGTLTFFTPRGFCVAALEEADVARLATRAARALRHRPPEDLTSRGEKIDPIMKMITAVKSPAATST